MSSAKKDALGAQRAPAVSVKDLLERDSKAVPAHLLEDGYSYVGSDPIPAERYTSEAYFEREVKHLWPHTWQMVCREEEIPNTGDHVVYDLLDWSFIVVRTETGVIKGFYNSCLHRGRVLRDKSGCVSKLRCPFHAFTWKLDGSLDWIPCEWDFGHIDKANFNLPEVKVGTWQGFVFINMDHDAPPLEEYFGPLDEHFAAYGYTEKYKALHVAKKVPCNWKVGIEAFIESFHVIATHPQLMPALADSNTQYDNYEGQYFNRMITATAEPSPHLARRPSEQEIVDAMSGRTRPADADPALYQVPPGKTARAFMGDLLRKTNEEASGKDFSGATDSEMLDAIQYFVFPNFFPWATQGRNFIYRFRPVDVDHCIAEVMYLALPPKDGPKPKPVPIHWLGDDETWSDAKEMGSLSPIFMQDMENMPAVQKGLKASGVRQCQLGNYQESRIRDFHRWLDRFLGAEQEAGAKG